MIWRRFLNESQANLDFLIIIGVFSNLIGQLLFCMDKLWYVSFWSHIPLVIVQRKQIRLCCSLSTHRTVSKSSLISKRLNFKQCLIHVRLNLQNDGFNNNFLSLKNVLLNISDNLETLPNTRSAAVDVDALTKLKCCGIVCTPTQPTHTRKRNNGESFC